MNLTATEKNVQDFGVKVTIILKRLKACLHCAISNATLDIIDFYGDITHYRRKYQTKYDSAISSAFKIALCK